MGELTLSDIQGDLILIVSIITSLYFLGGKLKEWLHKDIHEEVKPLSDKVDKMAERIDRVDRQQTKNYLVRSLADIERGVKLSDTELERLSEQYDHYCKKVEAGGLGGNSYIKEKYVKLQKEGLL